MYRIQCLNRISPVGLERFPAGYEVGEEAAAPDAVLVRSASLHEWPLPESLLAIARAGAGVNNIPVDRCSENGVVVFNTPGANANAVKELVLAALFLTSRKVLAGAAWVQGLKGQEGLSKAVEKGKSAFTGPEIRGKTLGVIGLGAIGILVANAARSLGMEVYGYDPFLSVDAAWGLSRSVHHAFSLDEIYAHCDYITLHVPATPDTRGMINAESIAKMTDGARLLNFARGELADSAAVVQAVQSGKLAAYATDFPSGEMLGVENILALPHLGASTPESEENCARMAADELIDYLENGNVKNSVNLPDISMPRQGTRICVFHRNVPNTISLLSGDLAKLGVNIENMQSKSKKEYAYTILDVTGNTDEASLKALEAQPYLIRLRLLQAE